MVRIDGDVVIEMVSTMRVLQNGRKGRILLVPWIVDPVESIQASFTKKKFL